ncbi:MAG TPA: glutamine--tRNA ligase/YqeY domain fusion protein [Rubrivivax sp.]|nr:glutamine--tRNA ligase/YqeY domain fusion protein [Rubrivivax sp.]
MSSAPKEEPAKPGNFLRAAIERDLEAGTYASRRFAGTPGDAAQHAAGARDPARIRTRFPPEPNGYLHVGHAKSIWLNFHLAQDYGGVCHLRFDDTNPEKEEQEYVDAIVEMVHWLGYDWRASYDDQHGGTMVREHLYYASDYFDFMYRAAEALVMAGLAYVDEQSAEAMRINRGDFATPGTNSPFRDRTPEQNLARLREMRGGKHPDGAMVLRAKIDMASPNINLRDPTLYRIKRATHHNTGDRWCIYPMYSYAHPIEDALENITHSICTLEFEDQRPFYDWVLERLAELGLLAQPLPRQYEFARLNLTYIVTSKRKLRQMVEEGIVDGWDDPRLPTLVGMRRRGYTPESLRLLAERSGVSKAGGWIDYSTLDIALRDDLDAKAPRAMAVLDPLKLVLSNWDQVIGRGRTLACTAPRFPGHPQRGTREFALGPEVWIEREDFQAEPPKGYHRLSPPRNDANGKPVEGSVVRLKYGYVIRCTGYTAGAGGQVEQVQAELIPDTRSGTPGADAVKTKGVLTWVAAHDALRAEVRLYDRLFTEAQPDAAGRDFKSCLNPGSKQVVTGWLEPSLAGTNADQRFQFERHGYFVADRRDHAAAAPVFNRITALKDGWAK